MANATTYTYTYTAVAPSASSGMGGPKDYGYVATTPGTVVGKGTLTVSNTVSTYQSSNPADCPGANCTLQGRAITAMSGTFFGEAVTFYANPHPPELFPVGKYFGNDLLLKDQARLLDGGGLIFSTATLGVANLLGYGDPAWPFYGLYDSNLVSAPTRTGKATEHFYGDFAISLVEDVTTPGGSEAAPTPLPLGSISAISGDIGPENLERFYSFDWAGGLFTSTASITDAQSSDKFVFTLGGNGVHQTEKFTLGNNFSRTLAANLAPGRYSIGLAATLDVDPQFSILFGTAVGGTCPSRPAG